MPTPFDQLPEFFSDLDTKDEQALYALIIEQRVRYMLRRPRPGCPDTMDGTITDVWLEDGDVFLTVKPDEQYAIPREVEGKQVLCFLPPIEPPAVPTQTMSLADYYALPAPKRAWTLLPDGRRGYEIGTVLQATDNPLLTNYFNVQPANATGACWYLKRGESMVTVESAQPAASTKRVVLYLTEDELARLKQFVQAEMPDIVGRFSV